MAGKMLWEGAGCALLWISLLVGCPSPSPRPLTVGLGTPASVVSCVVEARQELDRFRKRGQLEREVGHLQRLLGTCDEESMQRALFEALFAQDRWVEARRLLEGRTWPDVAELESRLTRAAKRPEDPCSLVARARTSKAAEARRLYDRALAGFVRTTETVPDVIYVDPAPIWRRRGSPTVLHATDFLGNVGIVVQEAGRPPYWISGRLRRLTEEVALRGSLRKAQLWNATTGMTQEVGEWPSTAGSPSGELLLVTSHPARVYQLPSLALITKEVQDPMAKSWGASWLDDDHLLIDSVRQAAVYSLREKAVTLLVRGITRAVSPDKVYLAGLEELSATEWRLIVVDVTTGATRVDVRLSQVNSSEPLLRFSPDGDQVAVASVGNVISVFDLPSGHHRRLPRAPASSAAAAGFSAIDLTEDGHLCFFGEYRASLDCEPMRVLRPNGRVVPPRGPGAITCLRQQDGTRIAPRRHQRAVTWGRKVVPGGGPSGNVNCNRAVSADGRMEAWFEAAEGVSGWHDHALILFDAARGKVVATIAIDEPNNGFTSPSMSLVFEGGELHATYEGSKLTVDLATGEHSVLEEEREPRAHFRAIAAAMTTLAPPWGVASKRTRWDLRTLRGVSRNAEELEKVTEVENGPYHISLAGKTVQVEHRQTYFKVTFFGPDRALVRHEWGHVEPLGFEDEELRCVFGDTVAPWAVCAERVLPPRRYREVFHVDEASNRGDR